MSLSTLVAKGVSIANSLTVSLQADVSFEQWVANSGFGDSEFATAQSVPALVEGKQKRVKDAQGEEVIATHTIYFLRPISGNAAAGRLNPIDPRDRCTLPDGSTGYVLNSETLINPDTGAGYYHIVYLGAARGSS